MADEEDKKNDRVISMKEFLKEVEQDRAEDHSVADLFDYCMQASPKKAVVICENEEGKMGFFTNCNNYMEILFFIEAYKKIILDNTVGPSYE